MDIELHHLFHEHPLILEETKPNDDIDDSNPEIICVGCSTPILGPFYGCRKCRYLLHKVCAELPYELNHPMHPQHPLALLREPPSGYHKCCCDVCDKECEGFFYHCSICEFDIDTICAVGSHTIEDKCHMHPLTPIHTPSSFPCHICRKKEEGVSYKCTICPFWVHQGCTVLPNTVRHSAHHHLLTILPSVLFEHRKYSWYCDICHDKLFSFYGSYACVGCLFFAHISCARSESILSSSSSSPADCRDQGIEVNEDSCQRLVLLPMQQKSTELISRFVDHYIGQDDNMGNKISCSLHPHPLFLFNKQMNEKTCDACAIVVSPPFYGCIKCDYFLHKCCTKFPKHILHASHPEHQLTLKGSFNGFFYCRCCHQWCNGFYYECSEGEKFRIDIKCASLIGPVYHEAHKHPLTPKFVSFNKCSACGVQSSDCCSLQCDTCSFSLCFRCAMAPPIVKHRYGKSDPFVLTYSPLENHYNEYICEICEGRLNPKQWFYHCVYADQFIHVRCMIKSGAGSNIKYGKSLEFSCHEHKLTFTSYTYEISRCNYCREPLRTDFSVGLECIPCNFRIHLICVNSMIEKLNRSVIVL